MREPAGACATVLARSERARTNAESARQRAADTLMQARRHDVERRELEAVLVQALAGQTWADGIANVWRAGYAQGWRDCQREA
jgi:hypothetical protein